MTIVLHKTEGSIRHYLKKLQERKIIKQARQRRLLGNNQIKIRIEDFS